MPKIRDSAPESFAAQPYVSERLRTEKDWDAKEPQYKHLWKKVTTTADAMSRLQAEPVTAKDGGKITAGQQMLCRVPIEFWTSAKVKQEQRSLREKKAVVTENSEKRSQPMPLTVLRNPRKPVGREQ